MKTAFTPALRESAEAKEIREQRELNRCVSSVKRLTEARAVTPDVFMNKRIAEAVTLMNERGDFDNANFSFREWRAQAMENYAQLGEANASSAWGQLFRGYIQAQSQGWYKLADANWPQYVGEMASKNRQEFHAPIQGTQLATKVGPGETYNEGQIAGLDIEMVNLKFGLILNFQKELFDDDQTGQIKNQSQSLGESMKITEEAYVAARLNGGCVGGAQSFVTTLTYGALAVTPSKYAWKNYQGGSGSGPYNTHRFSETAGPSGTPTGNVLQNPASGAVAFRQLDALGLKQARYQARNARNLLGLKMIVDARTLVISTTDEDQAAMLAHSEYYPAVPGPMGSTSGAAPSGTVGWTMTKNFLVGMIDPVENRYLQDWEWYLVTKGKGLVFQRRSPWEIVQEVPNSGADFNTDNIRFKSRCRFECDWVDSSFAIQGNDGSTVGSF